ncbi:MAG TPA: cupin domain-containing protein [Desulfatiglandales bacterium]|nr:cupin domain-containing protein [Desulfatiglandales bacterium]
MKVTRFSECKKYSPPQHDITIHSMHLQHRDMGCTAPYWVGCSYYLPGSRAEMSATPLEKVYVVLDGELTIEFEGGEIVKLGKMDSIFIDKDETREVRNETNAVATMLVAMPYPPAK